MTVAPTTKLVLEPAAQEFADATAYPPFLFDLGPEKGPRNGGRGAVRRDREAGRGYHRHHGAWLPVR